MLQGQVLLRRPAARTGRAGSPSRLSSDLFQHRFVVLHYAYLPASNTRSPRPFAHVDGFPALPVGRYSHDYYEACVTVELALLR